MKDLTWKRLHQTLHGAFKAFKTRVYFPPEYSELNKKVWWSQHLSTAWQSTVTALTFVIRWDLNLEQGMNVLHEVNSECGEQTLQLHGQQIHAAIEGSGALKGRVGRTTPNVKLQTRSTAVFVWNQQNRFYDDVQPIVWSLLLTRYVTARTPRQEQSNSTSGVNDLWNTRISKVREVKVEILYMRRVIWSLPPRDTINGFEYNESEYKCDKP